MVIIMEGLEMRCKCITSGEVVELYFYRVPINCDKRNVKIVKDKDRNNDKRNDNLLRARRNVRHIIWSNMGEYTKFITLTYKDTVLDIKKVKRDLQTFFQSMRRKGYDMKYLYVLENQKERGKREGNEGSLHVHIVLFIDKFIPLDILRNSWKHGFVKINSIDNVNNLGAYVCKYITKDTVQNFGQHTYFTSLGLNKPSCERFYTLGFSDSTPNVKLVPEQVLDNLIVSYQSVRNVDFFTNAGDAINQQVVYYQGKWKSGNIIERYGELSDLKGQIDSLLLS